MTDKVGLTGMVFYGYHGVHPEERSSGQRFVVDVEIECCLSAAGLSDRLEDTVDYSNVYQLAKEIVEGPPRNLLESLGEELARRLLEDFAIQKVRVRVRKPQASIDGGLSGEPWMEVERTGSSPSR